MNHANEESQGSPTNSETDGQGPRLYPDIICPCRGRKLSVMGELASPRVWCRQRWCRENPEAEHDAGDGCSCDGHGRAAGQPQPILLKARAAKLSAFACRTCGESTRRMIEQPAMFFRCEPCAAANRWLRARAGEA